MLSALMVRSPPDPAFNAVPSIAADMAKERATGLVSKLYETEASKLKTGEPELWIYNPVLIGLDINMNILVWRIEVQPNIPVSAGAGQHRLRLVE